MNKVILLIFVSVMFAGFFACNKDSKQQIKPGNAYVQASILGLENQMVLYKNEDPTSTKVDTLIANQQGVFSFTKHLEKPAYYSIEIGREILNLYIRPNDSLIFSSNILAFLDEIKFSGNIALYNNYLLDYQREDRKFQIKLTEIYRNNEEFVVQYIDSLKNLETLKLDGLKKSFANIDELFIKTEEKRIQYNWGLRRILYPFYYSYLNRDKNFKTSVEYNGFLNDLDVNDSSALILPCFREFIDAYYYQKVVDVYRSDSSLKQQFPTLIQYRIAKLSENFTSQAVIDYMCYDVTKNLVLYDGLQNSEIVRPMFDSLCKNEKYKNYINKQYDRWVHLQKGKPAKNFTFVNSRGDSTSLLDFRGKYVFIDIWATWCKPCLAELPSLIKLEERFAGKKIAFISISIDEDKRAWLQSIKEKKMPGIQLYAGRSDVLYNYYLVSGIPRFILIDKNGNVIEATCEKPSTGAEKVISLLPGL